MPSSCHASAARGASPAMVSAMASACTCRPDCSRPSACLKRAACAASNGWAWGADTLRSARAAHAQRYAVRHDQVVAAKHGFAHLHCVTRLQVAGASRFGLGPDLPVLERENALPAAAIVDLGHPAFDTFRVGLFNGLSRAEEGFPRLFQAKIGLRLLDCGLD